MDIEAIISEIEAVRKQGYGEYVMVKGIKIHCLVMGSGSPMLLLHGFGEFLESS